jgi:hypothetical protein
MELMPLGTLQVPPLAVGASQERLSHDAARD